ncbi:MAG: hypothetical protein FJY07_09285, partial [Bacteroidetes bacterium]|nr:hypothetical protein [Bacteroidota bacterium]
PVPVQSVNKKLYRFPWTGGMNSCQFGQIDLNLDGVKDLFVFDRHGDRIMTFVNGGTPGAVDYDFAPEYADSFPELKDWVILTDYDNDGKEDIFTKSPDLPGIIVYKNISVTTVEFELVVYPFLLSYQGGGYVNILVTDVDFPGISDIDGDGDLDILTFWGLGSFVEFHENQSIEKYGIPDSLDYIKTQNCWGHFAESDESNTIYLDTCSNGKQYPVPGKVQEKKSRHTGSSFLLLDMDQDNDKDLLLGDVGYPNIVLLTNGGNADSASITEYDTLFPSDNKPVNLVSMPSVAYLDINNNGINDLILSPFDPALDKSKNKRSAWLYLNEGENNNPLFTFDSEDFLQDDMIDVGSGAYPVLCDYDGDGLTDLLISNFGDYIYSYYSTGNFLNSVYWSKISLFRNTGTAENPKFNLVTDNFAQLDTFAVQGFFPAFSDLDNDGDTDMLTGLNDGTIWFFENTSGSPLAMIYEEPVKNYQGIDVGNFSTPQLFDLDGDGLKDLIAGEENGNLNYFNNTGTPSNPFFTFITDSLGKVNVTNYQLSYSGFSTPCFFRGDQNQTRLIVGSEEGRLFYYKNIDGNLGGTFTPNDSLFVITGGEPKEIRAGIRTAAALSDLNNDGFPDLIVGNFSGGLNYFSGSDSPPVIGMDKQLQPTWDVIFFPNPTKEKLVLKLTGRFSFLHLQISFYNSMTQLVFSGLSQSNEIMEIPVISFAPGVYSCEIRPLQVNVTSLYKKVIIAR